VRPMFNFFKKTKKEPQNLKEVVEYLNALEKEFGELSQELRNLKTEANSAVQKVGIVRFNPFSEVGSDQSFSVALLDKNDNGVVITSLYTREGNRVYAKPIKAGLSEYLLSKEEKTAIEKAKLNTQALAKGEDERSSSTTRALTKGEDEQSSLTNGK